jgi:hypothetical protein
MTIPAESIGRFFSGSGKLHAEDQSAAARRQAIEQAFTEDSAFLIWLAEVITGDYATAHQCVVDARSLSDQHSGVFVDWLAQWARISTIKQAVLRTEHEISQAAHSYEKRRCPHGGHASPTAEQLRGLQELEAQEIVRSLDAFARVVLLLRGVSQCTLQDCAIRLGTTRAAIAVACCEVERWMPAVAISTSRRDAMRASEV